MCFLATSAKLLKFTFVVNHSIYSYIVVYNYTAAFYYDANLSYFGWPHALYGVCCSTGKPAYCVNYSEGCILNFCQKRASSWWTGLVVYTTSL